MKTTKYIKGTKYTNYNYYKPENSRILCKVSYEMLHEFISGLGDYKSQISGVFERDCVVIDVTNLVKEGIICL